MAGDALRKQQTKHPAKLPTWPGELPLLPPAHHGNHGNASPGSTARIRGAMADAVIHADSQGQVRSRHVPIRPHRSAPTDDDADEAAAGGELHDPRRLSPRRARPFATPEQPRRLPIRGARPSSGRGRMDGSIATRRSGIERRGEAPGSVTGAASERGEQRPSGIWWGVSEASSSHRAVRLMLRSASGRQQRGRSAGEVMLALHGMGGIGGFSVAPPRGWLWVAGGEGRGGEGIRAAWSGDGRLGLALTRGRKAIMARLD